MKRLALAPLLVVHQAAAQPTTLFEVKAGHQGSGAYRKKMIARLHGLMEG